MTYKIPISVLVLVHTRHFDVLLLERADRPGFWQSITGSQEPGETLMQTAVRELQEETGLVAAPGAVADWRLQNEYEIFARWRGRYAPGVTHNTEHVFAYALEKRQPVRLAPREHLQYAWVPWQEAAEQVFSWSNAAAIRALPDRAGRQP